MYVGKPAWKNAAKTSPLYVSGLVLEDKRFTFLCMSSNKFPDMAILVFFSKPVNDAVNRLERKSALS